VEPSGQTRCMLGSHELIMICLTKYHETHHTNIVRLCYWCVGETVGERDSWRYPYFRHRVGEIVSQIQFCLHNYNIGVLGA